MQTIIEVLSGVTLIVGLITALIIKVLKSTKEIENAIPFKIKKQTGIDMEINQLLEELKEYCHADRVQIYDFHNGGHYANGRSALKTSCTYEVVRVGVKPKQMLLQAIPLSCITRFISQLLADDHIEVTSLEDIRYTMPGTYNLKKDMEIAGFYDVVLNNRYGEPIGFLAIQYTKTKYSVGDDKNFILKTKFLLEDKLDNMLIR